jgi:diadenosine tetraphosphate (Ap4A) HIT family hydrolase
VVRLATPVQKGDTMARINPDPYAGGHLFALVNRVTGLFDSEEDVSATVKALEADGVPTDDIDLYIGEKGAKSLDLSGKDHGRVRRWLRSLEASVGDERETNQRINDALHHGATLLSVRVRNRKNGDKERALQVLRKAHGHEIHYWGPWSFDDVAPAGPCAFCTLPAERYLGENEHAVWILDAHPVSPGHSLIAPKRHVESFFETTPEERAALMSLLDRAREHVCGSYAPSGYNIGINEGSAAGQSVPHLHVHLIPRFPGDTDNPKGGIRWVIPGRADYWSQRKS